MHTPEKVTINYLAHSAFICETNQRILIFDIGRVPPRAPALEPDWANLLNGVKPVFAFSSHNHPDHYDPGLHKLFDESENVRYITGDFARTEKRTVRVNPGDDCQVDDCRIFAVQATDKGIAALLQFPEISIYYGGDHAIWDDLPEFQKPFRTSMTKLAQAGICPDLAFIPVGTSDGWQEDALIDGCRLMIEKLAPAGVVPMHAYGYESFYAEFAEKVADLQVPVAPLRKNGDRFSFENRVFKPI